MNSGALAVALLGAVAAISAQAPPRDLVASRTSAAVIRGRVLAATDGTPIRKALVRLSGGSDERDPALSDDEGRFEFGPVPAGRYTVSAAKTGYATTRFGARRFLDRAIPIVVTGGTLAERIEILMPRGAAIMGRVTDDLGEPLVAVNVTAGRAVREDGRLTLVGATSTQTDDLGEYRLGGLAAGRYLVSVSSDPIVREGGLTFDGAAMRGGTTWARVYHPSTANLAQAQPIALKAGDTVSSIDFSLAPTRVPKLYLTVSDPTGQPAAGRFSLVSTSSFDALNRSGRIRDGFAEIGIVPGDWTLFVRGAQGAAIVPLSVDADDVSVNVVMRKPGRLTGRLVVESTGRAPAGAITLEAVARDSSLGPISAAQATAKVNADGTFAMTNLIGARRFQLRGAPRGWSLKALTIKGRSLLDGPVEFVGGEDWTGAVAVITDRHAELTGTVVDQHNTALTDYSVLVFPQERARWADPARWLRWARPDQTGAFLVDDLPLGPYLAIALSEVDGASWSEAESLESLRAHAVEVVLDESRKATLVLPLVGPP